MIYIVHRKKQQENAICNLSLKVIFKKKTEKEPGLMTHVLIPATRRQRQVVLHRFMTRLIYIPSSKVARDTQ